MNFSDTGKDIWTVKRILEWTAGYLASKGCQTPRLDAEVLLAHCLKLTRVGLYLNLERPLSQSEKNSYRKLVIRRSTREPASLIVGSKEFWSLPFKVLEGVLIPRPDSETLVEVVIEELRHFRNPLALEIGVGSGAISISVLRENSDTTVVGTDINPLALELAVRNAIDLGCGQRFLPLKADLLSPFRICPIFDVIYSNPPYIPSNDISSLAPEIVNFEPVDALNGGDDGLSIICHIIAESPKYLRKGGSLILEIGDGQAEAVNKIIESGELYDQTNFRRDLAGKIRVIKASVK
jgi:release factor glutamine methyltransferase